MGKVSIWSLCFALVLATSVFAQEETPDKMACQNANEQTNSYSATLPGRMVDADIPIVPAGSSAGSSTPAADIIDLVVDSITIADAGITTDVNVSLDITHSWVGDMDITLSSPSGASAVILAATVGNVDDVLTTFDDESAQPFDGALLTTAIDMQPQGSLADLDGSANGGDWTLTIVDGFPASDPGVLNAWSLTTDFGATPFITTGSPVTSTLEVLNAGTIADLNMSVNINHTFRGDLELLLTSPLGTAVLVQDNAGGVAVDLIITFDDEGVPFNAADLATGVNMQTNEAGDVDVSPLSTFDGEEKMGIWTLLVTDTAGGDDGNLNAWGLQIGTPGPEINNTLAPADLFIDVTDSVTIADLDLGLNITHTFRGDIEIDLTSPLGTTIMVQDNAGGGADDLIITFDDEGVPFNAADLATGVNMQTNEAADVDVSPLSTFDGEDSLGVWTVTATDTAGGDNGIFNDASLAITSAGLETIDLGIVSDTQTVPNFGIISDVNVYLDITHTWGSDLVIGLEHNGTTVLLENGFGWGAGGSDDAVPTVYNDFGDDPTADLFGGVADAAPDSDGDDDPLTAGDVLASFDKMEKAGDWVISLEDTATGDSGTLTSWCLLFQVEATLQSCYSPNGVSTPALAIPDNDPVGTSDTITVAEEDVVTDVNVALDISHTWVGDLTVNLTSPSLTTASILAGSVGNVDNVNTIFDDESAQPFDGTMLTTAASMQSEGLALATLNGGTTNGDWVLFLSDSASGDAGTLNSWSVILFAAPVINNTLPPAVTAVSFAGTGQAANDVNVQVDISHTWVGDVTLELDSPAGTMVILADGTGGNQDNFLLTYDDAGIANASPYNLGLDVHMQTSDGLGGSLLSDFNSELIDGTWTLIASDDTSGDNGQVNGWCLDIAGRTPPCTPPTVDFAVGDNTGNAPFTASFTSTIGGTDSPFMYMWDFGDTNTSTDPNPSNEYMTPGTYSVTLTVTNACGSDSVTMTDLIVVTEAPVAAFTAAPTFGVEPLIVDFTDATTGDVDSYAWDFGDTNMSSDQNPQNIYAAGVYTVSLTATGNGDASTDTQTDLVQALAMGDCDADNSIGLTDVLYLANYLFSNGPAPLCPVTCDVNFDGNSNLGDAIGLANFLFLSGPAPATVPAGTPCN